MKKIVCLIPLYNEQEVLGALFLRLGALFDSLCARYEMSALLVDDGSADGSLALLREQHARDGRFRYLSLSRNFGKEAAMMAGFDALGTADAVIVLDADLQDPPELIPQMLELFEQGYDDVYARRRSRAGESAVKRLTSHLYYRVLGWLSAVPIQPDTGDFRLLSHRVVAALQKLREMPRCTKSLFSWVGYRKTALYYDRDPRAAGKSKFRFMGVARLRLYIISRVFCALGGTRRHMAFALLAFAFAVCRANGGNGAARDVPRARIFAKSRAAGLSDRRKRRAGGG